MKIDISQLDPFTAEKINSLPAGTQRHIQTKTADEIYDMAQAQLDTIKDLRPDLNFPTLETLIDTQTRVKNLLHAWEIVNAFEKGRL